MTIRRTLVDLAVALLAIVGIAIVLELWSRAFRVPAYLLPAPSAVAARMATDAGLLAREGGITLGEAAAGFVLGTGVAFTLATVMAWSRPFERTLFPLAILVKLTPIVAVAPLFTLWFGFGTAPKVAIAALITFFPMLVNSFVGLRSADLQEVAFLQTLGASGREIFRHLRVPSALPYLFSGARISLNLALIGAVIGEWTGADREGHVHRRLQAASRPSVRRRVYGPRERVFPRPVARGRHPARDLRRAHPAPRHEPRSVLDRLGWRRDEARRERGRSAGFD